MTDQWVILELSNQGEKELPEDLKRSLEKMASKEVEIFVPSRSFYRRENAKTICVLEGYIFMRAGYSPGFYFEFENSPFIAKVLAEERTKGRYLQYLDDDNIQQLRAKLDVVSIREVELEDRVKIIEGVYSDMEGVVKWMDDEKTEAAIEILGLKSLNTYVTVPVQFLIKTSDDTVALENI